MLQTGFVLVVFIFIAAAISFSYTDGEDVLAVGAAIMAATAVFGYVVARLTLAPTRTALVAQKQFVGNIAHELRTPLSIIKTNTEVALLDPALDGKVRKTLRSNVEELDRISQTINNLLSMSSFLRPEKIPFEDVDAAKVLDHAVKTLTPFAEHKHLTLTLKKSDYNVIFGNASALNQIFGNIIKNAISYTPPSGSVEISLAPDYRGSIIFIVEDTGVGIRQKDLESIFEPFYRADYSRNRAFGGSGLGLAIVSELVKLHHGKISIRSVPEKGTKVIISLPCGSTIHEQKEEKHPADAGEITVDFTRQ